MAGAKGRSGGHNRKSLEELDLLGTKRKDRHAGITTEETEIIKDSPVWTEAKTIRKDIKAYLEKHNASRDYDHILLDQLVNYLVLKHQVEEAIALEGLDYKIGTKGAVSSLVEIQKEIRIIMAEFRLTPATRERIQGSMKQEEDDGSDDILAGPLRLVT